MSVQILGAFEQPRILREDQVNGLLPIYRSVQTFVGEVSRRRKLCGLTVLFLSVLTSGSLWLLLSQAAPVQVLWASAVASTLTTLVTIYVYWSGMNQSLSTALASY